MNVNANKHSFVVGVAIECDVHSAVLLDNIAFWIEKNKANNVHFYDGRYWTYNSKRAFAELYPYLTERQVKYALEKLRENGLIMVSNFNKASFDKTLWYSLTDKAIEEYYPYLRTNLSAPLDKNVQRRLDKIVQPIPYSKPDINTNINNRKNAYAENILMSETEYQKLIELAQDKNYVDDVIDSASCWKQEPKNQTKAKKIKSDYLFVRKWLKREFEKNPPKNNNADYEAIWQEVLRRINEAWSADGWSSNKVLSAVRKIGFSKLQQCSSFDLEKMKRAFIEAYKEA